MLQRTDHRVRARTSTSSSLLPAIAKALLGIASFLFVSAIIGFGLRHIALASHDIVAAKYRRAIADPRINTLFFGASLIEMGVDPRVFDTAMARRGYCIRSYNVAVGGMSVPEIRSLALRTARTAPHIKYIFIAPTFALTDIARQPDSIRAVSFFGIAPAIDYAVFLARYSVLPAPRMPLTRYVRNISRSVALHYSNLGMGLLLSKSFSPNWEQRFNEYNYDAFFALRRDLKGHASSSTIMKPNSLYTTGLQELADRRRYYAATHGLPDDDVTRFVTGEMLGYYLDLLSSLRLAGAHVMTIQPPSAWQWQYDVAFTARLAATQAAANRLLDFDDPAKFPGLFDPRNRYDGAHLNHHGAVLWSGLLADRFADVLDARAMTPPDKAACGRPAADSDNATNKE